MKKVAKSADGINVRVGETYYVIRNRGTAAFQIHERTLRDLGGAYFTDAAKNCFYARDRAVEEIIRRLNQLAQECRKAASDWAAANGMVIS